MPNKSLIFRWVSMTLMLQMVSSCVYMFQTPYERFIDAMNTLTQNNMTIEELQQSDPRSSDEFVASIELLPDVKHYHYARPNIWEGYCYFYFVVNNKDNKVIGWGFDYDKADPTKTCGVSG